MRFEFEDLQTKEQNKLGDIVDIETTVSLLLWIQGYALKGVYFFSAAVFTSQFVCHGVIQIASFRDWITCTQQNVSNFFLPFDFLKTKVNFIILDHSLPCLRLEKLSL